MKHETLNLKFIVLLIINYSLFITVTFAQQHSQQLRMVPCSAPSSCKKNTIYHETNTNLGRFNYNSVNFEHLLKCQPTYNVGIHIGVIYYSFPKLKGEGIPIGINWMFGRGSELFEFGFGATYQHIRKNWDSQNGQYNDNISYAGITGNIGFRHQNSDGGLFYKVGFTPMYSVLNYKDIPIIASHAFIPMAGISIGWTFR